MAASKSAARATLPAASTAAARQRQLPAGTGSPAVAAGSLSRTCTRSPRCPAAERPRGSAGKLVSPTAAPKTCSRQAQVQPPVPQPSCSSTTAALSALARSTLHGSRHCSSRAGPPGGSSTSAGSSTSSEVAWGRGGGLDESTPAAARMVLSQRCCSAWLAQLRSTSPTRMQCGRPGSSVATASHKGMLPRARSLFSSSTMAGGCMK
mmetsp:Transcript_107376/g.346543  ORF Transcript_107376/g.346543 Transcript_107376/m.346543 type:complete len:207 (-) Transcript_107376:216-836(-)